MAILPQKHVEVQIERENGKAVIQGKTSVPFKTFVSLILQRKVQTLFKDAQNEPVIIGSELLTKLASAPDDKQEDRGKLVTVTLGVGMLCGIFISAFTLFTLELMGITPTIIELCIVMSVLIAVAGIASLVQRMQGISTRQKIYDQMERISDMISK